jgi:hypothetical protein
MIRSIAFALCVLAACGGDEGGGVDAPFVPATINVSGTASEIGVGGRTPVEGVVVEAYREGQAAVVATATSAADGTFTVVIETGGVPLDGYLLAKHSPHKNTYLYPPAPLIADTNQATVLLLTQGTFDAVEALTRVTQDPAKGFIGINVLDAANMSVAGATVSSSPAGVVKYNSGGLPNETAAMTDTDGLAFIFNVGPGTVNVSASKDGSTFNPHPLEARAGEITTTLIQ